MLRQLRKADPVMEKFHRAPVKDYMAVAQFAGDKDFEVDQPDSYELQKNFTVIERRLQPRRRQR